MAPTSWTRVFAAWLIAACSSLGALFLGEVMHYTPCALCWYQRIFMFPLVIVLGIGLLANDRHAVRYALPLALGGLLVAIYHVLLTMGIIPERMTPCSIGVSCAKLQVVWFGFVTIPLLSMMGFVALNLLLVTTYMKDRK